MTNDFLKKSQVKGIRLNAPMTPCELIAKWWHAPVLSARRFHLSFGIVTRDPRTASSGTPCDPARSPAPGPVFIGLHVADADALADIVPKLRRREP